MPRDQQSRAINIWLETEYLERPLLARTLIQRCQPSVVSSSRAARSMRSRSALRRASRSSSVGGLRLKRRAIVGSLRLGGPPRWRLRLRLVVELVGDRALVGVRLGRLALGPPLIAGAGLGLVVGGVGALDGLLEPSERRGDVRPGELLECLGGEVLV